MRSIKASVKIGVREALAVAPGQRHTFRRQEDSGHHSLYIGWETSDEELIAILPRYDEEGDPVTELYIDEIADAVKAIVDEHNAAIVNEE